MFDLKHGASVVNKAIEDQELDDMFVESAHEKEEAEQKVQQAEDQELEEASGGDGREHD